MIREIKKETIMFTNSEMIISLWLVPVVITILLPLGMLCSWACMQLIKKMVGHIVQIWKSILRVRDEFYVEGLQSEPAA